MGVAEHLRVIENRRDAFNARDWERFLKFHVRSITVQAPGLPEPLKGHEGLRQYAQGFIAAFPDIRSEVVRSFGDGNWACAELTAAGTHTGPMQGPGGQMIRATNKRIRMALADLFRFEGGQITEVHEYFDLAGMMAQLGLMK